MILVPYALVDGVPTVSDEVIKAVFHKINLDGTLNIVFPNGRVDSEDEFLKTIKSPDNLPVFVLVDGKISGFAWVNGVCDNHAMAHFCCFKETWGVCTKEMGQKVLDYWFSFPGTSGPLFDVLIGMIPEFNHHAISYAEDLGFNRVGAIPKMVNKKFSTVVLYKLRQ